MHLQNVFDQKAGQQSQNHQGFISKDLKNIAILK